MGRVKVYTSVCACRVSGGILKAQKLQRTIYNQNFFHATGNEKLFATQLNVVFEIPINLTCWHDPINIKNGVVCRRQVGVGGKGGNEPTQV